MIKIASLFSGVGTPELALDELKIDHQTVFACEIDKYARETYLENNTTPIRFYENVYDINGNDYKDIDILIGGSSCQSFSSAGKRKGLADSRGALIYEYFRIVKQTLPKVFIFENVKGFTSIDKGSTFKNFKEVFVSLGYNVFSSVLNTKDYNIPQNRERLYIVGFLNKASFTFPQKEELSNSIGAMLEKDVDKKYLTPNDENLPIAISTTIKPSVAKNFARDMDSILVSEKDFYVSKATSGWQDNKIGLKTVPTIRANNNSHYVYDRENSIFRRTTPRECFNLQGFDEKFKFPSKVSNTQLHKQAGNAMSKNVLVKLFEKIIPNLIIKEK